MPETWTEAAPTLHPSTPSNALRLSLDSFCQIHNGGVDLVSPPEKGSPHDVTEDALLNTLIRTLPLCTRLSSGKFTPSERMPKYLCRRRVVNIQRADLSAPSITLGGRRRPSVGVCIPGMWTYEFRKR
jgi:hypothetical protein